MLGLVRSVRSKSETEPSNNEQLGAMGRLGALVQFLLIYSIHEIMSISPYNSKRHFQST
jgi:hypothetical protein